MDEINCERGREFLMKFNLIKVFGETETIHPM